MSLKTRNIPILVAFVFLQLATILLLSGFTTFDTLRNFYSSWSTLGESAATTALVVVLSEVLGDQAKARLVFWRWRHPLPGCFAFTRYASEDIDRIDVRALARRHGKLPKAPTKQNHLWLRMFHRHQEKASVAQSHGRFLLLRDMTAVLVVLAIAVVPVALILLSAP